MKTIVLKFSGPLQSWGTDSHFETRHTDLYPSKSAVVGLIAAALGYRRSESRQIADLNRLHFAVRVDQSGTVTRDFQTAHKYKPNGDLDRNYVTYRYYLEDAVFLAAIGHDDRAWMDQIEQALRYPYFQPYLGRRSDPLLMDAIVEVCECDPVAALKAQAWQAADWYKKDHPARLALYADADLVDGRNRLYRKDAALSFAPSGRQYTFRQESRIFIDLPTEEHDAFAALGD